ncbi:Na+/H+ antiporter subunit E [Alcaligenaceae bacterium SJ-26]|nr:Na+/H+ antiporter subunit E [Alcaligenaceae bacterium SJ-26]
MTLARRWVPMPLMSLFLLAMWLLMNQTVAFAHILLGAALGLFLPWIMQSLIPDRARVRRPWVIVRLFFRVLIDIVKSNIAVARIVLGGKERASHSGFMYIPLELKDPYGLAVLSCIITSTPGTVWVEYDQENSRLLIHVLDLQDESVWLDSIKGRYESLLREIFES